MPQLLSVGTIIDRAWSHYTKHFLELMGISSWLLLIAILTIISTWISPDTLLVAGQYRNVLSVMQITGIVIYGLTYLVLAPILSIWISNQLTRAINLELDATNINTKELSRFGWKKFFPRVFVGILTAICVLAPFLILVPGGIISVIAGLTNSVGLSVISTALIFIGVIAATVGCLYVIVRLIFAPYALLLDDHHGRSALKQSAALSRGRFWSVFFRVVIPAVVFYIGMTTIHVLLIYVMKTIVISVAGLNATLAVQLFSIGRSTIFIVLNTLVAPLVITANCLVYRDLTKNR